MDTDPQTVAAAAAQAGMAPETLVAIEKVIDALLVKTGRPGPTLAGATLARLGDSLLTATKPFWTSKTLIAGLVAKLAAVAGMVGLAVDPHDLALISTTSGVVTVLGVSFQSLFHVISTKRPV